MISVTHFVASDDAPDSAPDGASDGGFAARARRALDALAERPGYLRGSIGRSTDDDAHWVLITEWANVGSYRRALGGYEAKLYAMPLLAEAIDVPSSFEPLVTITRGGTPVVRTSDREPPG